MDITTWKKLYYMQQKISKGSRLGRISLGIAFYILTAYLISSAAMPVSLSSSIQESLPNE